MYDDIKRLTNIIENISKAIEELYQDLKYSRSWQSKIPDYVLGGVVGAIISMLITMIFN